MNDLSFSLYLADILPSLANGIAFMSVAGILFCGALLFWAPDSSDDTSAKPVYVLLLFICVFGVIGLSTNLVPSRQTIYMILASEAAEEVITSQEGKELLSDIKTIIKKEIDELKKDE